MPVSKHECLESPMEESKCALLNLSDGSVQKWGLQNHRQGHPPKIPWRWMKMREYRVEEFVGPRNTAFVLMTSMTSINLDYDCLWPIRYIAECHKKQIVLNACPTFPRCFFLKTYKKHNVFVDFVFTILACFWPKKVNVQKCPKNAGFAFTKIIKSNI